MGRHSGTPFNEDHPDYERLVLQAPPASEDEPAPTPVMQLIMPPQVLLAMLHDEMWQLKWHRWTVYASGLCAAIWVVLVFLLPYGWPTVAGMAMSLLHGLAFGIGLVSLRARRNRWSMLGAAHTRLHEIVADIEGDDEAV